MPKPAPYGPADFQFDSHVSRETLRRLAVFAELLERWNARINLIGASTIPDLWRRHMLDSAQLAAFIPAGAKTLLDLGAGAGFPGLVLSIMGAAPAIHLVEADQRKGIFLREAIRITGAPAILHPVRIEALNFGTADVITARALAPLGSLLAISERFRATGTVCLFPKGERLEEELTAARAQWHMDLEIAPSRADSRGKIVIIKEVRRV